MSRPITVLFAVLVMASAACGGGGLTDEEFAEEAAPICATFAGDLAESRSNPLLSGIFDHGPVYRAAHDAFAVLEFDEESAPGATALQAAMRSAADAWDAFISALRPEFEALEASSINFMFGNEGSVFMIPDGDLSRMVVADIDRGLLPTAWEAESAVGEAAAGLSLNDCVPPAPDEEE